MPLKKCLFKDVFFPDRHLLLEGRRLKSLGRSVARVSFATPRFWPLFEYPSFGWLARGGGKLQARLTGWWGGRAYFTVIGAEIDFFLKRSFWRPLASAAPALPQGEAAQALPPQGPRPWGGFGGARPGLNYVVAPQAKAWSATGAETIKAALKQKMRVLVITPSLPWLTGLLSAGGHWPVSPVYLGEADEAGPLAKYSAREELGRLASEFGGRLAETREKLRAHSVKKEALKASLARYDELESLKEAWRNLRQEAGELKAALDDQRAAVAKISARWQEAEAEHKKQLSRWWWPFGRSAHLAQAVKRAGRLKDELEEAEFKAKRLRSRQLALLGRAKAGQAALEACRAECERAGSPENLRSKLKAAELVAGNLSAWQRQAQDEVSPPGGAMARLLARNSLVLAHSGHLAAGEPLFRSRFNLVVAIGPAKWLQSRLAWDHLAEKAPQAVVIDVGGWSSAPARSDAPRPPVSCSSWLGLNEGRIFQAPWLSPPPISQSFLAGLKNFAWPPGRPDLSLNLASAYWAASAARWLSLSASFKTAAGEGAGYVFCANRFQACLTGRLLADFRISGFQTAAASEFVAGPLPARFMVIDSLPPLALGVALASERLAVLASRSWLKRRLKTLPGSEAWGASRLEPLGRNDLASGPGSWLALPELAAAAKEELLLFLPPLKPYFWNEARNAFLGGLKRGLGLRLFTTSPGHDPEDEYAAGALNELRLAGANILIMPEAPWPQAALDRQRLAWTPQGEAGPNKLWLTFEAPRAALFWRAAVMRARPAKAGSGEARIFPD